MLGNPPLVTELRARKRGQTLPVPNPSVTPAARSTYVRALRKENPNKENPQGPATGGTFSIVAAKV